MRERRTGQSCFTLKEKVGYKRRALASFGSSSVIESMASKLTSYYPVLNSALAETKGNREVGLNFATPIVASSTEYSIPITTTALAWCGTSLLVKTMLE